MSFFSLLFKPLRRAYSAVFRQHVSVRVAKGQVRVVLRDDPMSPAHKRTPSRAELAARKEQQELVLIQRQLAELLNDLPETRATLRHLVFVEQALERKGLKALHKLPLDVLQRALEQLEGLVVNWSPVGLAALRSKMAVAIIDRETHVNPADAEADAYRTAAVMDTMPAEEFETGLDVRTDDDALAAAYAALGDLAPAAPVQFQGELGSASGRVTAREPERAAAVPAGEIKLRELQS
jgi:hypothetical protein